MDLYIVIATRRSGHHAIINWLDSILDGTGIFVEDTDWAFNKPLFVPNLKDGSIEYLNHDLSVVYEPIKDSSYCIFNIEERDLSYIKQSIVGSTGWDNIHLVLNHRSFLNFLSSKINHPIEGQEKNLNNGIARWVEYSNEILEPWFFDNFTTILFDKWVIDKKYRESISTKFDGNIDNEITNKVPQNGMGSTFDGMSHNGSATKMDVLNRKNMLSDDLLAQSNEMGYVELSNKIFK